MEKRVTQPLPTITPMDDKPPTLKEAQTIVGGYVQLLDLPDESQLLVDEDGLSKELPINYSAMYLLEGTNYEGQRIVGNALLLKGKVRWS